MVGVLLAIIVPLVFLYVIWALEIFAVSRLRLLLTAVGWGVAAFGLALLIQNTALATGLLSYRQIVLGLAPILEETLKAILLVWLASRMLLGYAVDGTAYGFAIGTGFAAAENLLYSMNNPDHTLEIVIGRVLSTSLMHAFTTAIVGTLVGSSVFLAVRIRFQSMMAGLVLAMLVHFIFNLLALSLEGLLLLGAGIAIGLGGIVIIILLMQRALQDERKSITHELTEYLSVGEIAAAVNPQQMAEVLVKNQGVIGKERAHLIHQYITLEGQRGIVSKTIRLNQRPKFNSTLEKQLHFIEQELQALRSSMGLYTWVWLRTVLPSEESTLWSHLDHELDMEQPVLALVIELSDRQKQVSSQDLTRRVDILRGSSLFQELPLEDLEDLGLLLQEQHFSIGDYVVKQGERSDKLYCVAAGSVLVNIVDSDGTETILSVYTQGDTFGEFGMLDEESYPISASCLSEVTVFTLPRRDFITLIYAKPQVGLEMMRQIVREFRRQTNLLAWVRQSSASQGRPE